MISDDSNQKTLKEQAKSTHTVSSEAECPTANWNLQLLPDSLGVETATWGHVFSLLPQFVEVVYLPHEDIWIGGLYNILHETMPVNSNYVSDRFFLN